MKRYWTVWGLVVLGLVVASGIVACEQGGTETPSPLPTVSPLAVGRAPVAGVSEVVTRRVEILWEHPAVDEGWVTKVYTDVGLYTGTVELPDWRGYVDVELRQGGAVVAEQMISIVERPPTDTPGTGMFAVVEWVWDLAEFEGEVEEWTRLRWSAEGEEDVIGIGITVEGEVAELDGRGFCLQEVLQRETWTAFFPRLFRRSSGDW